MNTNILFYYIDYIINRNNLGGTMKKDNKTQAHRIFTNSMLLAMVATGFSADVQATTENATTNDWYQAFVKEMTESGFLEESTTEFLAPDDRMTVADFATMVANGFYGETLEELFHTTTFDFWWAPYFTACYDRGGLEGTSLEDCNEWEIVAGTPITRYDMAAMIYDLLKEREITPLTSEEENATLMRITDEIDSEYRTAVATAYYYGILIGNPDGSFSGGEVLTRAESAVVMSALVRSELVVVEQSNFQLDYGRQVVENAITLPEDFPPELESSEVTSGDGPPELEETSDTMPSDLPPDLDSSTDTTTSDLPPDLDVDTSGIPDDFPEELLSSLILSDVVEDDKTVTEEPALDDTVGDEAPEIVFPIIDSDLPPDLEPTEHAIDFSNAEVNETEDEITFSLDSSEIPEDLLAMLMADALEDDSVTTDLVAEATIEYTGTIDSSLGDFVTIPTNTMVLNGTEIPFDLSDSFTITPDSLSADAVNFIAVEVAEGYTLTIDDTVLENGMVYPLTLEKLGQNLQISLLFTEESTGEVTQSYLRTYPADLDLTPITVNNPSDGYYYFGYGDYALKLSTTGELVYFAHGKEVHMFTQHDFEGTTYYSYLEESFDPEFPPLSGVDYLQGQAVVLDENYQEIDRITHLIPQDDVKAEPIHINSFQMIAPNHYLVGAYIGKEDTVSTTLHSDGQVRVAAAMLQEIKDGALVLHWDSTNYPELYEQTQDFEAYATTEEDYCDYVHLNAIMIDPTDDNILISLKNTNAILKLDRETGDILWTLGGKGDDFALTDEQQFMRHSSLQVTDDGGYVIFNNNVHYSDQLPSDDNNSGVMKFYLDQENLSVTEFERYNSDEIISWDLGSGQELENGNYLVSWGKSDSQGYQFTEIDLKTGEVFFGLGEVNSLDGISHILKFNS